MIQRARVPLPARVRIGLILAGAVFACWLPYQLSTFDVALYDRMGLYALVTIGLTLLMGYAGQISLGQGAFFLIGAYTSAILTVGIDPDARFVDPDAGVSPLLAVLAAPLVAGLLAALIGIPLLRLHGHYLAFATLALHLIAFSVLSVWDRFTGGQYGITVTKPLTVFGHELKGPLHAAVVWAIVAIALLLATNLVRSRVGRALQAIATDEPSAAASGVPVASYKLRLFVLAAALAGLGGGLFTFSFLIVSPEAFPIVLSIQFVVMVAVGGLGNIYGAVAGTVAILYLEQKLRELGTRPDLFGWDLPDAAPTVFSFGVFGLILMAIMLFFPRGLLPAVGRRDGWRRGEARAAEDLGRKPEQPGGILLQDQRSHLVPEVRTREVLEPAVRRDQRVIGAEEDPVAQQRVRVVHELGRKVLRRPTGEVDEDLLLVERDRDRLVLPREGGCASTILSSGKSTATSSTYMGFEYLSRMPPPPGSPGADPRVAGMEQRGQTLPPRRPRTGGRRSGRSDRTPARSGGT